MADYWGITRTNYFTVNDEEKFRQAIVNAYCSNDDLKIFEEDFSGVKKFGFGCFGVINGTRQLLEDDDEEGDYDVFIKSLQEVVADDDTIIITEVGFEKLRYLVGRSEIITKTGFKIVCLHEKTLDEARILIGNPEYTTQMKG